MGLSRRQIILIAAAVVLLAAYAAAGFLAVPHFARQAASDFVRTHYGRTLVIGDLRFEFFVEIANLSGEQDKMQKHINMYNDENGGAEPEETEQRQIDLRERQFDWPLQ